MAKDAGRPGIKFDAGKPRFELLPFESLERVAEVLTFGALKYEPDNWKNIENGAERYVGSLLRHVAAWKSGERVDGDSGLHHLAHAACCALFVLWFENDACPTIADVDWSAVFEKYAPKRAKFVETELQKKVADKMEQAMQGYGPSRTEKPRLA